jgi:hypothetical protein
MPSFRSRLLHLEQERTASEIGGRRERESVKSRKSGKKGEEGREIHKLLSTTSGHFTHTATV